MQSNEEAKVDVTLQGNPMSKFFAAKKSEDEEEEEPKLEEEKANTQITDSLDKKSSSSQEPEVLPEAN